MKSSNVAVGVLRTPQELARLAPEWERLAASALEPSLFYEPWVLLPALQSAGAGIVCATVRIDGGLAGLFPFAEPVRYKGMPFKAMRSWRHTAQLVCTPLVHAACAEPCLRAIVEWLADRAPAAAAELRYIPADGAFAEALKNVLLAQDVANAVTEDFERPLLLRDGDAEAYIAAALSKDSRKSLRRKERRLSERGAVRRVALSADENPLPWILEFLALEASGWKGRAGGALACAPATERFAIEMLAEAHRRGRLQLTGIDCDGRPVARCINLLVKGGAYAWRTAFDEEFADYSPGVLCELDVIRAFHADAGLSWIDSFTDPGNRTLSHLWRHRLRMQSVLVSAGAWPGVWVSALPTLRSTKRLVAEVTGAVTAPL